MTTILKFVLNTHQQVLDVHLTGINSKKNIFISLTYEYLRIFSPCELSKVQSNKNTPSIPEVFHKKNVNIITIESVGKHGYRIVFDDDHHDVFSAEVLFTLSQHFEQHWPLYIKNLSSTNSREASINFKSVS